MPSYQTEAKRILKGFQAKASRYENQEILLLANKWQVVSNHLGELITKLSAEEILSADKLFKLDLYKQFLQVSQQQVNQFNAYALKTVTSGQEAFAAYGLGIAQDSLGLITVNFNRINIAAVNNMIGFASDGSPLYTLFARSYPESVAKLTNTLITSTTMGYNPAKTARLLAANMDGNLSRALTIARTEQMNVLRETSIEQMQQSGVCRGWIRIEQPDACDDCLGENGKHYGFEESFDSHPNCRGAAIPDV